MAVRMALQDWQELRQLVTLNPQQGSREMNAGAQLASFFVLFYLVEDSSPWMISSTFWVGLFLSSFRPLWKHLQKHTLKMSFLDNSQSSKVDSKDELSFWTGILTAGHVWFLRQGSFVSQAGFNSLCSSEITSVYNLQFCEIGIELRPSYMLGKHYQLSNIPSPKLYVFITSEILYIENIYH